jgi:hypothetical protein
MVQVEMRDDDGINHAIQIMNMRKIRISFGGELEFK